MTGISIETTLELWASSLRAVKARIAPMLAFAAYLTLVNMVFVASLRYRLPIEPFMIVFAATAVVRLAQRWPAGQMLLARFGASRHRLG